MWIEILVWLRVLSIWIIGLSFILVLGMLRWCDLVFFLGMNWCMWFGCCVGLLFICCSGVGCVWCGIVFCVMILCFLLWWLVMMVICWIF